MTIVMRGSPAGGDSQEPQQVPGQPMQQPQPTAQPPQPTLSTSPPPQTSQCQTQQSAEESGQGDAILEPTEDQEPEFPLTELAKLDEMINRPRWVVPVLAKGELEVLLDATTKLCKEGKKMSIVFSL